MRIAVTESPTRKPQGRHAMVCVLGCGDAQIVSMCSAHAREAVRNPDKVRVQDNCQGPRRHVLGHLCSSKITSGLYCMPVPAHEDKCTA